MSVLHDIETAEYFWVDFIFSKERKVPEVIDTFYRNFTRHGMIYKFHKGNDGQLNYTILDRDSGKQWMVDLYESIRASKGKTKRRHEYIVASFNANFTLPDYAVKATRSQIEAGELLIMLQYNGRWVFKRETFSCVVFFCKDGVLGAGEHDFQRENLKRAITLCKKLWHESSPVFCWMDVSSNLYSEAIEQITKGRVPSGAWFTISSRSVYTPEIIKAVENSSNLIYDYMNDGSMFIENIKCRRGRLKYL